MRINEIRIYFEVFEQGIDIKEYVCRAMEELHIDAEIKLIYSKKTRKRIVENESIVSHLRKVKDIDIMISSICDGSETPISLIEYSTAVRTDDHVMQRSDVIYWGSRFKIPSIKISPDSKGSNANHGGGSNISEEFEMRTALNNGAVFYPIKWESDERDLLNVNSNRMSCIPYSHDLQRIVSLLFTYYKSARSHNDYYNSLLQNYKTEYSEHNYSISLHEVKGLFGSSSRFTWNNNRAQVKINRFGHALDPERGIVYFMNMLLGVSCVSVEFQVERTSINNRMGYKSLFDRISHEAELLEYVTNIFYNQNNTFTNADAIHVFFRALNIDTFFENRTVNTSTDSRVFIPDDILFNYLTNAQGFAVKSLFILSKNIVLTDKERNVLVKIVYNREPIDRYLTIITKYNYNKTDISLLSKNAINEDLVTFSSMLLFKKASLEIMAISFPGAQGDRCILIGNGRSVKRKYIDIISYYIDSNGEICTYLYEAKKALTNSKNDVKKLKDVKSSTVLTEALKVLTLKIINNNQITSINIGIGGKGPCPRTITGLDYIMFFNINNTDGKIIVEWDIAVINTAIINDFNLLVNDEGRMSGTLDLGMIYSID